MVSFTDKYKKVILQAVNDGKRTIGDIAESTKIKRAYVRDQLYMLAEEGNVEKKKKFEKSFSESGVNSKHYNVYKITDKGREYLGIGQIIMVGVSK